ncbi:hypothetical protein [uncultured Stenotrophomonas sp.]|uniref:hypothetical protein n=1 Tax=uncultured Stenotrophomonas sp. TaxID=165438 RepID=UPI0025E24D6F|nr:hypothetical protein [uncultured Stenotrophomonas sp.]
MTAVVYSVDVFLLAPYYKQKLSFAADAYADILLSIAGLTGVFIGLYYAALSAVGSTLYSQFPVSIRSLLKEERTGATYMRFLSWLGFACVSLAMFRALGAPPSALCLIFSVVFCAVAIFGFAHLGRSVFDFFDPATLSYEVYASVQRQIKKVAGADNSATSNETHKAAHRAASNSLNALDEIRKIVAPREHLKDSYIQLVGNAIRLSIFYSLTKQTIHPKSQWYPQEHRFDDWYRTGDSTTSLFVRSGIFTHPNYSANFDWVEERINPIITQCISDSISTGLEQDIARLLNECANYVRYRSYLGESEDSLIICDHILATYAKRTIGSADYENQEWALLADAACSLYVESLTHYKVWHTEKIKSDLSKIISLQWGSKSVLANSPEGGRYAAKILEISEQIAFEFKVNGERSTPNWFIEEHFKFLICARIAPQIKLIAKSAELILGHADELANNERVTSALAIYSRLLEYLTKASGYIDEFELSSKELSKDKRIKGLVWQDVDYEKARASIEASKTKLIATMAVRISRIPPHRPESKLPDYAGQFLDTLAHDLLSALWSKDAEKFGSLYKDFFLGSIAKYMALLPKDQVPEHMRLPTMGLAISPVVDAMEIAGIAVVIARAFNLPAINDCIRSTWHDYMNDPETSVQRKGFVSAVAKFSLDTLSPVPREITRTGWRGELLAQLRELPRRTIRLRARSLIRPDRVVADHADPLVRVVANDDLGMFITGVNAFCFAVLEEVPAEVGVELGFQHDQLRDSVRRATALDTDEDDD